MVSFDHPHFSDGDLVIQSALREDARNSRAPRYRQTPVTGIRSGKMTVQARIVEHAAAQKLAERTFFEAVLRRNEMIVSMARLKLNRINSEAIEIANTLVLQAEQQMGDRNGILLDADQKLDMQDFEDLRAAMHARFDSLTAPSLDDPNAEHQQAPSDVLSNLRSA